MTKFVILSLHRSGTSVLCQMLGRHPDVLCHYEIFHPKTQVHVKRGKAPGLTEADLGLRRTDPQAFVARIYEENSGKAAVGFKMWRNQAPTVCKQLLQRRDVHKIVLERGNTLARYSSHLLAHRNLVWGMRVGSEANIDRSPLQTFDRSAFRKFVRQQKSTFRYYRKYVSGPHLHLSYERLTAAGLADVLPFLGLPSLPIEHGYQKLYSADILARFAPSLHGEIIGCLREFGRPEWVSEDPNAVPATFFATSAVEQLRRFIRGFLRR